MRRIAFVRSMYVTPSARGKGVGRQLMLAAIAEAASWNGVEQISLSVTASNHSAIVLYRHVGFVEVGRMPRALRVDGVYHDELSMVRMLAQA